MKQPEQKARSGPAGIALKGLTKVFRQPESGSPVTAVDHVELTVEPGELLAFLGPSGCGKTTILRLICGFEDPTEGSILLDGRDQAGIPPDRRGVSLVFQNYALFPHLNVWNNIAYGLQAARLPREEIHRRTASAVALMQLSGLEDRFPHQLSGGQLQRTALARAVVIEPRVLLFDEPLCNLDAKLRESMRQELRSLVKRLGITALYVTHDQAEAMAIADRIAVLRDGRLCQLGTPVQIYEQPVSRFVAGFIGRANFVEGVLEKQPDGTARVSVGTQLIAVPAPGPMEGLCSGDPCCLAIRPEALHLSASGEGLPGTVSGATYYGSRVEYEVMVEGRRIVAEVPAVGRREQYAVGQRIFVQPFPDSIRVLSR